jgi:hypothetical protein
MTIVMNMSGYEIERETIAVEQYGDEVLNAGWNPQLAQVVEHTRAKVQQAMPRSLARVDVDEFLNKMYAYQS